MDETTSLLEKANAVMQEMEDTYGRKRAHNMMQNVVINLCRYDDVKDTRPFVEQVLSSLVSRFVNCSKISKGN